MLIDDYMNYLNENYEIYDEEEQENKKKRIAKAAGIGAGAAIGHIAAKDGKYIGSDIVNTVKYPLEYRKEVKAAVKQAGSKLNKEEMKHLNKNTKKLVNQGLGYIKQDTKDAIKHHGKKALLTGAAAGAAYYGAKKLRDHVKAKRNEKAKKIAVEEGCSLNEAYEFILECEMDLINEGYELYEIYED